MARVVMANSSFSQFDTASQSAKPEKLIDLGDGTYALAVATPPETKVSGSLTAAGTPANSDVTSSTIQLVCPVPAGAACVGVEHGNNLAGTLQFELTSNSGGSWRALVMAPSGGGSPVTSATAVGKFEAGIPPGTTHIRVRCSTYTSGAATVEIACGYQQVEPVVGITGTVSVTPTGGSTGIGASSTIGALSTYRAAGNAAPQVNVKSTGARVYSYEFVNNHASAMRYVHLFNKATAPVMGTDVPLRSIPLVPGRVTSWSSTVPLTFGTGLGFTATDSYDHTSTGGAASGEVVGSIDYA